MKSLNFKEFNSYLSWCESQLLGAQLQAVWTHDWGLVLEFYKYRNIWVVVDLKLKPATIVLIQNEKIKNSLVSKKQKPVGLFLNSNAKNLYLEKLNSVPELGRVGRLNLVGKDSKCQIEFILIPGNLNILVETNDKKISWNKPVPVIKVPTPDFEIVQLNEAFYLDREQEWISEKFKSKQNSSKVDIDRLIEKKEKALLQMQEIDYDQEAQDWVELGECLKNQLEIPEKLKPLLDPHCSRFENQEKAFHKAKSLRQKKEGHFERIQKLKIEIEKLKKGEVPKVAPKIQFGESTKSRTLELEDGKYALLGKSAKDNLSILRQSRAWDYWLHLKDYPGAHVIIFRNKNQKVSQVEIQKVCDWLLQETVANKKDTRGLKLDVVVTECRYVKPIKGDQLGRVNYQNPQVYRILVGEKRAK